MRGASELDRKPPLIGLGIAVAVVAIVAGLAWALEEEEPSKPGPGAAVPPPAPRAPGDPCPPPGPSVVVPRTGRTLCGAAARRYVRRQAAKQARAQNRYFGFTPARRREARRLIAADATLRQLLRGKDYRLRGPYVWHREGGSTAIGGAADISAIAPPISATAVVPYVCQGDPRVGRGRLRLNMRGVTNLHVLAHFASRRVVEITTGPSPLRGPQPSVTGVPLPGSARCPPTEH